MRVFMTGLSSTTLGEHDRGIEEPPLSPHVYHTAVNEQEDDASSVDSGEDLTECEEEVDCEDEGDEEEAPTTPPAANKTDAIRILRILILCVLIISGILVAIAVYSFASKNVQKEYQINLERISKRVSLSLPEMLSRELGALDQLATDFALLKEAGERDGNLSWPFVVIPDFEKRVSKTRLTNRLHSVMLLPVVKQSSRVEWEGFSLTHHDVWLNESLEYLSSTMNVSLTKIGDTIPTSVYTEGGRAQGAVTETPMLPLWQVSPALPQTDVYNCDMTSVLQSTMIQALSSKMAVLGESFVVHGEKALSSSAFQALALDDDHANEPLLAIAYPIRDRKSSMTAVLLATIHWRFILDTLLVGQESAVLVVSSGQKQQQQQQSFAFQVESSHVTYAGSEDEDALISGYQSRANTKFDVTTPLLKIWNNRADVIQLGNMNFTYTVEVFVTGTTTSQSSMAAPWLYAGIVILFFAFSALLFICYDHLVHSRQKQVVSVAMHSTKIVNSLFPSRVRDRLYSQQQHQQQPTATKALSSERESSEACNMEWALPPSPTDTSETAENSAWTESTHEQPKRTLRRFLRDASSGVDPEVTVETTEKPIADLFPSCTVMFADIVGFTAWSSAREPTQVFMLLQNVYLAFDKVARKRKVFKVETIGDCYVAVTGLPDPQSDHAVIMAEFAMDIRTKFKIVTRKLERALGPETGDLSMRFGLHSGPVTAGVLGGERSRFQLFGDTVNTSARMESTGMRKCIQVSQATANLLVEGGRGHWVTPREGTVSVKGKGEMQTFWLEARRGAAARRLSNDSMSAMSRRSSVDTTCSSPVMVPSSNLLPTPGDCTPGRGKLQHQKTTMIWGASEVFDTMPPPLKSYASDPTFRLIDWNVDILLRLLKKIVIRRSTTTLSSRFSGSNGQQPLVDSQFGKKALDEVVEIIALPNFDPSAAGIESIDLDSIELEEEVEMQLRDYVLAISSMYRDNPFHNYEHACHVQMSMLKLLQRVVTPNESEHKDGTEDAASEAHNFTYGITSDPLTQFAVVFSALIHDVDHTGVANGQLIKENATVALLYDGKSVAEQNSVDLAWESLMDPKYAILRGCIYTNEAELKRFRQLVVNVVLATDIFDKELGELRKNRWAKAFSEQSISESAVDQGNRKATIVIEHLIQASDVSHTMQHWEIYRKWNERLFFEMYSAFKSGRTETDPSPGWYKGEIWFFDNYVIPLAKKLQDCGVFGVSSAECLNYATENRRLWEEQGEQIVQDMMNTDYFRPPRRSKRRAQKKLIMDNTST